MNPLLRRALDDPSLSSKALGILFRIVEDLNGHVPSAEELTFLTGNGRYSIQAGLRELRERGFISTGTIKDADGYFHTYSVLVPDSAYGLEPVSEDEHERSKTDLPTSLGHKEHTTATNNDSFTNVNESLLTVLTDRQQRQVRKDFFKKLRTFMDMNPNRFLTQPAQTTRGSTHRHQKSFAQWSIHDMGIEFAYLAHKHAPTLVGQINQGALRKNLKLWLEQGLSRDVLVRGIQGFFQDPQLLTSLGDERPLWIRFLNWFPKQQRRLLIESGAAPAPTPTTSTPSDDVLKDLEGMKRYLARQAQR